VTRSVPGPRVSGSRSIRFPKRVSHGSYSIPSLLADTQNLRVSTSPSPNAITNSNSPIARTNSTSPKVRLGTNNPSSPKAVRDDSTQDSENFQYIKLRVRTCWLETDFAFILHHQALTLQPSPQLEVQWDHCKTNNLLDQTQLHNLEIQWHTLCW
jgi:hypothetical protein